MNDIHELFEPIKKLHETIRARVVETCENSSLNQLSEIVADDEGDTIFAVDRVSEEILIEFFEREIAAKVPIILIAEGLENGKIILPKPAQEADCKWIIIVDPIDGTRGLMYQKRSAWILTGVAPNKGEKTNLSDIEFAIQTEIPLVKQHLSDTLWAFRGKGGKAERFNRLSGETFDLKLKPSQAKTIEQGFAQISRFFPGVRDVLAEIDEEIVRNSLGLPVHGKAQCFEDQYISTGGQIYELIAGHDRFCADLRPLMQKIIDERGLNLSICCHPYDLCTELIAREFGVIITDGNGETVHFLLDNEIDVAWIGYANEEIRNQIEPILQEALRKRGLL
ncbi:MAG TPA: inositol monophosphatase family protein [Pyrinomonadaceae bacterium]|nr:inositol monophosphatase family protein [Pyrinomonadaceae bacterium]